MPTQYTYNGITKGSEQAKQLAHYLSTELESSLDARDGLRDRWEQNERVFRNDPSVAGTRLYDNFEPRAVPVMSPRIKRIVNVTVQTLMSPSPMLQAIPDDKDQEGADVLEQGLQTTWELAGFERIFRRGLTTAALCGVSVIRMRMAPDGLRFEHIHPNDFVIAPTYGLDMRDAHIVGHRFYIPRWMLRDRIKSGMYDLVDESYIDSAAQKSPDDTPSGRDPGYDLSRADNSTSDKENDLVELYELLLLLEIDGKRSRCRVVYDHEHTTVLMKEKYVYSRPWYFDVRFHDEEGKWWPANSVAQNIVGLCYLQSDMFNLLVAGSMATCVSPTVISGGTLGKQVNSLSLGHVYQSQYDLKVQQIPLTFNPQYMPVAMQYLDDQIEAETGVMDHRLMQADRKSGDVTARQIAAEESAAAQNEGTYPGFAADTLEQMARLWLEFVRLHPSVFRQAYGAAIPQQFYGKSYNRVRWVATGKNPGNSPEFLIGKMEAVYMMSQNPMSILHPQRTENALLSAMQLPINLEGVKKTNEEMAQTEAALAQAQMAQQEGNPGIGGFVGGVGP